MKNTVNIRNIDMSKYYRITNTKNFEELGRAYAVAESIEYAGDEANVNMSEKYAELGKAVCKMSDGFFYGGCFYGKRTDLAD